MSFEKNTEVNMKDLIESYQQYFAGFEEELEQRTASEIAYDNVIIKELSKGRSIKKALKIAAKKYPDEALQYIDENIDDIKEHYEFLLNHDLIKKKIARMTN
jgi:hypothetical protein